MTFDEQKFRQIIREEVKAVCPYLCSLEDTKITPHDHAEQHKMLASVQADWSHVRKAFLAGVLLTVCGGIFTLVWLGIKAKLTGG